MDLWHSYKQQGLIEEEATVTKLDEVLKRFESGATRSNDHRFFLASLGRLASGSQGDEGRCQDTREAQLEEWFSY